MKELDFKQGRLAFNEETLTMLPCLPDQVEMRVRLYLVDADGLRETGFFDFKQLPEMLVSNKVLWLHLSGTLSSDFWRELKDFLDLTDEQVKHIRSPHSKAVFEDFHNGMFLSLPRPSVSERVDAIEDVNLFFQKNVLVTRQFSHDNAFSLVTHRLMERGEFFSPERADRLAAELIHDVVEAYFALLQLGGTRLEDIQNRIIQKPGKKELALINRAQQVIWIFLNFVWPIETSLQIMHRSANPVLSEEGRVQLAFRQDEAAAIVRLFETYRAMSYNLMDVYVSGLSLRTNDTTIILTVIATLFLPPSLIAGIYGMNFNIPEVHIPAGYYFCLASMFFVSGGLLFWLKRRGFIDL
ncbi:MAG: hypothetical protein J0M35_11805 [Candidatus Obscuribacter phosphatis]|uniref:Magnesium and cobalt transport protein CorA n=1 Tax=Candidatus Obscuribacter phosphatis TaxID=1906157 RepID=A0A8J7PAV6_9BACT|nr:hypothetical protein [Candidatus Obscuribacter phosphatis]